MKYNFIDWVKDPSIVLSEAAPTDKLHLSLLPCAASDLAPALSALVAVTMVTILSTAPPLITI